MIQVAYGYGLFTGRARLPRRRGAHGAAPWCPPSSGNTLRQILLLQDFRPQGLACTPSFALYIAEAMARAGDRTPARSASGYGMFGAEPWTEAMRAAARAAAGGSPRSTSTDCREIIGPGVAGECAEGRAGLHVNEDHFLPEVIDPRHGRVPLPPGDEGELVLTSLHQGGAADAPLPHRRRHQRSIPTPCPCGRTTVRMARVKGRTDDMLVIKGVNVYPSQLEAALLAVEDVAPHYQLLVDRTHEFPTLEVQVEPTEGVARRWGGFDATRPEALALAARVSERLRGHLGVNPRVEIVPPKTIPRSEGKAVRVIERAAESNEIRAHICFVRALGNRLNVRQVRLAGCLRAPPRSWTLLLALAGSLRQAPGRR